MAAKKSLDFLSPNGDELDLYTLSDKDGIEVDVLSFGATLTSLRVPKAGGHINVILGHDDMKGYLENVPYLGSSVGRVAGRISKAKFTLDGADHVLSCNQPPNHLHGGSKGFSKMNWALDSLSASSLTLTLTSPDGDQGYPGEVKAAVTYEVKGMSLSISYTATTNKATPINLVNHAYFNLSGKGDTLGHVLQVQAESRLVMDENSSPTGETVAVKDSAYDFTTPCTIGARIGPLQQMSKKGYDDVFCLNPAANKDDVRLCAKVKDPSNGLCLSVCTNQPAAVLYTGNYLDTPHTGVCLETQNFPDAINQPSFPSCVLRPGEEYCSRTQWSFTWEE